MALRYATAADDLAPVRALSGVYPVRSLILLCRGIPIPIIILIALFVDQRGGHV